MRGEEVFDRSVLLILLLTPVFLTTSPVLLATPVPRLPGHLYLYRPGPGFDLPALSGFTGFNLFSLAGNARGQFVALHWLPADRRRLYEDEVEREPRAEVALPLFGDILFGNISGDSLRTVTIRAVKNSESQPLRRWNLALSGDGSRVAFTTEGPNLSADYPQVQVYNRAGTLLKTFEHSRDPAWLPDGRLLTICKLGETTTLPTAEFDILPPRLCIHDFKAGTVRVVTPPLKKQYHVPPGWPTSIFDLNLSEMAVSPDGKRVAVVARPNYEADVEGGAHELVASDVWTFDLNGSHLRKVLSTLPPAFSPFVNLTTPVWSPDGKTLAVALNGRLAFVDAASNTLTLTSSSKYGQWVYQRPVWWP